MFRPDGAHLFVRRKFTALCLRKGFIERGFFLGAELKHRLIFPSQLQEHAGEVVLHFSGKTTHGFDCFFQQFGHGQKIDPSPGRAEGFSEGHLCPDILHRKSPLANSSG
jgi:hypothetical protein